MPQVLLAKAVRYPFDSTVVHARGETIEVDAADVEVLRERGIIAAPESATEVKPAAETPAATEPEPGTAAPSADKYPALPPKTAPVAEWKEYARVNDIKLTGLTKRNEIIGFVTKAVTA